MSVCYCYRYINERKQINVNFRYYVLHRKPPNVFETRAFAVTVFLISFALYVSGLLFPHHFSERMQVLFGMSRASSEELSMYINHYVNEYDIDIKETFGQLRDKKNERSWEIRLLHFQLQRRSLLFSGVVNVLGSLATPAIVWTVLTACFLSVVNIFVGRAIYRFEDSTQFILL